MYILKIILTYRFPFTSRIKSSIPLYETIAHTQPRDCSGIKNKLNVSTYNIEAFVA